MAALFVVLLLRLSIRELANRCCLYRTRTVALDTMIVKRTSKVVASFDASKPDLNKRFALPLFSLGRISRSRLRLMPSSGGAFSSICSLKT